MLTVEKFSFLKTAHFFNFEGFIEISVSKISFTKSIFIESKKVCYFIANNLFFMLLLERCAEYLFILFILLRS